jgi:hypothetical protein
VNGAGGADVDTEVTTDVAAGAGPGAHRVRARSGPPTQSAGGAVPLPPAGAKPAPDTLS